MKRIAEASVYLLILLCFNTVTTGWTTADQTAAEALRHKARSGHELDRLRAKSFFNM
jgi:hypothetical protein